MAAERFDLVVEALADEIPAEVRLRALLKVALRRFRLRCTHVSQAPDPGAWVGWRRPPGGAWGRVCTAADEDLCRKLVAERIAAGLEGEYVVIPRGKFPCAEP